MTNTIQLQPQLPYLQFAHTVARRCYERIKAIELDGLETAYLIESLNCSVKPIRYGQIDIFVHGIFLDEEVGVTLALLNTLPDDADGVDRVADTAVQSIKEQFQAIAIAAGYI